jgi:proteasome accessory factor B
MPKQDRLARLVHVQRLLSSHPRGLTVHEIMERCEVSRRTAYRDLEALQVAKLPLWNEAGRWFLDQSYYLPPIKLTLDEAMALFIASRLAYRFADERSHALEGAFEKLADALPSSIGSHVLATVRTMKERPVNADFSRALEVLTRAWADRRTTRIWYSRSDDPQPRERCFDPYFIEPSGAGRATYAIGHDHASGQVRIFKVERIRSIELTGDSFTVPPDFQADDYLRGSWGIGFGDEVDVALRFTPDAARRVRESIWHPSQQLEEQAGGSLLLRLRVAGLVEITPWVLS